MKFAVCVALFVTGSMVSALETGTYVKQGPTGAKETLKAYDYPAPFNFFMATPATLTRVEQVGGERSLYNGGPKITVVPSPTYCKLTYIGRLTQDQFYPTLKMHDVGLSVDKVVAQPERLTEADDQVANCKVFTQWMNEKYLVDYELNLYMSVDGEQAEFKKM